MRMRAIVLPLVLALSAVSLAQRSLTVFAAASLREPFEAIAREFERKHPGVDVRLSFAGSQQLASQIRAGAPADVFASAAPGPVEGLGNLVAQRRLFAQNRLAIVTPPGAETVQRLSDLAKVEKVVLAADSVPAGMYARRMLASAARAYGRAWLTKVERSVVSQEVDVRAALIKVIIGEADAGIVYVTDAKLAGAKVRMVPVPVSLNVTGTYMVASMRESRAPDLAKAFVKSLLERPAQAELLRVGFTSPLRANPELAVIAGGSATRLFVNKIGTWRQTTVKAGGKTYKGASLRAILGSRQGLRVVFFGADGHAASVPLSAILQRDAVLVPMGDGNLQVVVPGQDTSTWVKWLRRVEVR